MVDALSTLGDYAAQDSFAVKTPSRFAKTHSDKDVTQAAQKFESMFMAQMLQPIFEGIGNDPLFGGGHGEEMMKGFLVQEYGKSVSLGSGGRLTDAIKADIIRLQSQAQADKTTGAAG